MALAITIVRFIVGVLAAIPETGVKASFTVGTVRRSATESQTNRGPVFLGRKQLGTKNRGGLTASLVRQNSRRPVFDESEIYAEPQHFVAKLTMSSIAWLNAGISRTSDGGGFGALRT